jgi:FkbM family methyltransferase
MREHLKSMAIACGIYGSLHRLKRRLVSSHSRQQFARTVEVYSSFISKGDLCFDIGANIGAKTEVFLAIGATVVAIEPQDDCFRELVARCSYDRRLTAINSAVGAQPGEAMMHISDNRAMSSLAPDWGESNGKQVRVSIVTLDQLIERFGQPQFCKIDVEGFELEVIKGLSRPIPLLTLEYHLSERNVEQTIACVDRLAELGSLSINLSHGEQPDLMWTDWVDYRRFRTEFPARAPRTPTCSYGDLFIRMS